MFILGVNSAYHESAACLTGEGRVLAAAEEERFNRVKHAKRSRVDNAHEVPWRAIEFCLAHAGIGPGDVRHVGYSLDPDERLRLNRDLPDTARVAAGEFGSAEGEERFHQSNLEARRLLSDRFPNATFHFLEHHLCHAASAWIVSPFEDAAVLAVDGIGEFHSTWLGAAIDGRLERLGRIPYPHSLGFLWEKFSEHLGFDAYSGPGKMMGYAALTDPLGELSGQDHKSAMQEVLRLESDGTFTVDNSIMRFRTPDFSELGRRFGPRRIAMVDRYEEASIASALQERTEDALIHVTRELFRRVNEGRSRDSEIRDLCVAGGVALNCVANDRILRETPFERLWIQPAANDAGTALGAAVHLEKEVGGGARLRMEHAFLGPAFGDGEIVEALDRAGLASRTVTDPGAEVARRLEAGQIVAWFTGAQEFGPRALGHRSILADPTRFDTRTRLNARVKQRESFRPFAPSVLDGEVDRLFDLPPGTLAMDYMLTASPLRDSWQRQLIPAVVQENGQSGRVTGRLHRVCARENPEYYHLIEEFRALTGVGAVLNTSFNISEPIVTTPAEATATFARSGMDAMMIGGRLVEGAR